MNANDLHQIFPLAGPLAEVFAEPLNAACMEFNISTKARQASFLAQVGHESGQLRTLTENLNYSAKGLMETFGKYFTTLDDANGYAKQPGRIAGRVYANRMGNGDEASGDGWRYRGAGLIQITGKNNQAACAKYFDIPIDQIGDWLRTPVGASRSAAWYWRTNGINELADAGDQLRVSKRINCGSADSKATPNGLAERLALFLSANRVLV